jgi:hypothetical protein
MPHPTGTKPNTGKTTGNPKTKDRFVFIKHSFSITELFCISFPYGISAGTIGPPPDPRTRSVWMSKCRAA